MTLTIKNIILDTLSVCEIHLRRLNYAKSKLAHLFPMNDKIYGELTNDDIAFIDHFIERFSKLQDAMGAKLFPQILELSQEQGSLVAFVDKLNRLEKIGAISDAHKWTELRALRNSFAHDYPSDITLNIQTLNTAFNESLSLEDFLKDCKNFMGRYLN